MRTAAMALAIALSGTTVGSCMSPSEIHAWISSTTQVVVQRHGPVPGIDHEYAHVRGTRVSGYLLPAHATHGFLDSGQEIVAIPLGSGGSMGVNAALLFTVVNGHRRFVGYLPGPSGHLGVSIREGRLEQSTPIYGVGDPNWYPSHRRIQTFTLSGIRLVKVDERVEHVVRDESGR